MSNKMDVITQQTEKAIIIKLKASVSENIRQIMSTIYFEELKLNWKLYSKETETFTLQEYGRDGENKLLQSNDNTYLLNQKSQIKQTQIV